MTIPFPPPSVRRPLSRCNDGIREGGGAHPVVVAVEHGPSGAAAGPLQGSFQIVRFLGGELVYPGVVEGIAEIEHARWTSASAGPIVAAVCRGGHA